MRKIISITFFIALITISCSKDDSDKKDNGPIVLKKMIETYQDGSSLTSEYTYDGNKLMNISYSNGTTDNYTYAGLNGNLSKIEKRKNGILIEEENFEYTNPIYLSGYTRKVIENNHLLSREFVYHNFNSPATYDEEYILSHTTITNSEKTSTHTSKYTMNGDNIFQITDNYGYDREDRTTYQYDAKNNPLRYSYNNDFIILARQNSGINNILVISYTGTGIQGKTSNVYTYNSDNFPVTSEETNKDGKKIKREYFY